jgi:DNA polymerase-3 subunit epsilon
MLILCTANYDTNDKQFSLDQLFAAYNIPLSDSAAEDAYKTALLFFKIKIKIGY